MMWAPEDFETTENSDSQPTPPRTTPYLEIGGEDSEEPVTQTAAISEEEREFLKRIMQKYPPADSQIAPEVESPNLNVRERNVFGNAYTDAVADAATGFPANVLDASVGVIADSVLNQVFKGIEFAQTNDPANRGEGEEADINVDYTGTQPRNVVSRFLNAEGYADTEKLLGLNYGVGEKLADTRGVQGYIDAAGTGAGFMNQFTLINFALANKLGKNPEQVSRMMAQLSAGAPSAWAAFKQVPAMMIAPYLTNRSTAAIVDTVLGAGGGIGQKAEIDLTGQNTGAGFLVGSFSPIVVPATMYMAYKAAAKSFIGKGIGFVGDKFSGYWGRIKDARARELDPSVKASDQTSPEATKAAVRLGTKFTEATEANPKNLARASEVERLVNENKELVSPYPRQQDDPFNLTIAERTQDSTLLKTQEKIQRQNVGEEVRVNDARLSKLDDAVQNFRYLHFSADLLEDTPTFVVNTVKDRREQLLNRITNEKTQKEGILKLGLEGYYPNYHVGDRAKAGANARVTVMEARANASKQMDDLAVKLNINTADPVAPASRMVTAKKTLRKSVLQAEGESALSYESVNPLVKKFLDFDGNLTFQDWKVFRENVGTEMGKMLKFGASTQVKDLFSLREALDVLARGYGKTNKNFEKYNETYRKEFISPFDQSTVHQVMVKNRGSTKETPVYVMHDELVLESFAKNTTTAREFVTIAEKNPTLYADMRGSVLNKLARVSVGNDGKVNLNALNLAITKDQDVFDILGVLPEIKNSQQILSKVSERVAGLNSRKKKIHDNRVIKALNKATDSGNLEQAFSNVLSSPRDFVDWQRQVRLAGKEAGVDLEPAFREVIVTRMMNDKNMQGTMAERFEQLKPILMGQVKGPDKKSFGFSPEHIKNLQSLTTLLDMQSLLAQQKGLGKGLQLEPSTLEKFGKKAGFSVSGLTSLWRSLQESRISKPFFASYIFGRAFSAQNKIQQEALMKEAIERPEFAKILMSMTTELGAATKTQTQAMRDGLFRIGTFYGLGKVTGQAEKTEPAAITTSPTSAFDPIDAKLSPPSEFKNSPPPVYPYLGSGVEKNPTPVNSGNSYGSNQNKPNLGIEELFPFDSTSAAIAKRRNPNQGIQSIV